MKKKSINEAWEDPTGLLFPSDNQTHNRAPWFSWLPDVLIMEFGRLSPTAWRL